MEFSGEWKPDDIITRLKLARKNTYTIMAGSYELEFNISTTVAKRWFGTRCQNGPHEPEMATLLINAIRERKPHDDGVTVFDIGTHLGLFSVLASAAGANAVHGFDLDQERLGIVRNHPSLYNDATLICGAISTTSGQTIGYAPRSTGHLSTTHAGETVESGQKVVTLSLDDYCSTENISPDIVKLDIEGGEIDALRGFESTLSEDPPKHFLVEVHPDLLRERGEDPKKVEMILEEQGYNCERIPGDGMRVHATYIS